MEIHPFCTLGLATSGGQLLVENNCSMTVSGEPGPLITACDSCFVFNMPIQHAHISSEQHLLFVSVFGYSCFSTRLVRNNILWKKPFYSSRARLIKRYPEKETTSP